MYEEATPFLNTILFLYYLFIWLYSSAIVFYAGAMIALVSLALALNMPSKPDAGNEVLLGKFS